MPYVDLAGLSRFAGKSKDFASSACAGPDMANWQKTAAAGAVSFSPVPEMPLDPVVNFAFTETGPASGTKGPDNPSTITGVSSVKVTRCGKNLVKLPFFFNGTSYENNDVTFTLDQVAGTITANGTASADARIYFVASSSDIKLVAGKTYFLSGCPANGSVSTYYIGGSRYTLADEYLSGLASDVGSGATWSTDVDCNFVASVVIKSGTTVTNLVFKPMLEEASTATSFETYDGADYTILFNGTYYGGSVDLSTGVMTVTYRAFELTPSNMNVRTPTETASGIWNTPCLQLFGADTVNVFGYNTSSGYNGGNYFCNILDWNGAGSAVSYHFSASNFYLTVAADSASAATTYITNLIAEKYTAGTPIFAGYPLATPYTVQLNPTQIYSLSQPDPYTPRINTVYSDQVSVQVGYPKSPQASQTELTNAIVSLGGNV